jgi:hypothetical protein
MASRAVGTNPFRADVAAATNPSSQCSLIALPVTCIPTTGREAGGVVAGALEPLLTDRVSGRLTYSTGMLIFSPEGRAKMIFPDWSGFPSTTSTFSPVRITMYCAWAAEATRLV